MHGRASEFSDVVAPQLQRRARGEARLVNCEGGPIAALTYL